VIKWTSGNDDGEVLEALEFAIEHIQDAQYELEGFAELKDHYGALQDCLYEMQRQKELLEANITASYAEQIRERMNDWERERGV
jgi:FtsZ-binding cell division protein ZapB